MKKKFTVYVPVIHSEIYHGIEAESPEESIRKFRLDGGQAEHHCSGETCTGRECQGDGWSAKEEK